MASNQLAVWACATVSHMTCVHCACHVSAGRAYRSKFAALFGVRIKSSLLDPLICTLRSLGTLLRQKTSWSSYLLLSRNEKHSSNTHPAGIFGNLSLYKVRTRTQVHLDKPILHPLLPLAFVTKPSEIREGHPSIAITDIYIFRVFSECLLPVTVRRYRVSP